MSEQIYNLLPEANNGRLILGNEHKLFVSFISKVLFGSKEKSTVTQFKYQLTSNFNIGEVKSYQRLKMNEN